MSRDAALAAELRNATARMARLFRSCRFGAAEAVDRLDEIMRDVDQVAARLDPAPSAPRGFASTEGRVTTGTIRHKGRTVRVERARRGLGSAA